MQREMAIVGPAHRTLSKEPPHGLAVCKTLGGALQRAQVSAGMTQETLAGRMGISEGYLSLLYSGKRNASVVHVLRAVRATGSLAPIQWVCVQVGGELYCDEKKARAAALRAEADEIERAA